MSLRVGGLASVPTNKGKRTRRPSDGVVEDCGSLWRMRQHASAKKESGLLFLFALRDRSPSEHVNASHSILLFCFFYIFYFFTFAPVCSCLACVGPIERFPPSSSSPCRSVGIETRSIHLLEREAGCVVYRRSQVSRLNSLFPATTFQGLCLVSASS